MGLIHKLGQVLDEYADLKRGPWERLVRPVLKDIPAKWLEERTGLSRRTIQRLRNGHSLPRKKHEEALTAAAVNYARTEFRALGLPIGKQDAAALAMYLDYLSREPCDH